MRGTGIHTHICIYIIQGIRITFFSEWKKDEVEKEVSLRNKEKSFNIPKTCDLFFSINIVNGC